MAYLKTGHYICSCFKEECSKDCPSYKKFTHKKTNANHIRSMADGELAKFLWDVWRHKDPFYKECVDGWLAPFYHWLKEEYKE